MIDKKIKAVFKQAGKIRLYARVGLSRMTFLKAYRMIRYWTLTSVFKKKIPWLIELSVTYRCQCRCRHCSVSNYFSEVDRERELTSDEIRSILKQAVKIGIPKVDYFGGEPLLKEDIVELVRFGSRLGVYISITTNAWLLTWDMVKRLKDAGISCINVSLDSADEQEHDELRGLPGIYKKAVAAISFCHQEGITCIVSTYATRRRIEGFAQPGDESELAKIIDLSRELKASAVRILFPIISGEWVAKKKIELNEGEKRWVIENIDPSFAFIEGAYSVKHKKKVCQALSGKIFNVSPYGDIQLCIAFPDTFGNIRKKPLQRLITEMWSHPTYLKNKNGDCCSTVALKR